MLAARRIRPSGTMVGMRKPGLTISFCSHRKLSSLILKNNLRCPSRIRAANASALVNACASNVGFYRFPRNSTIRCNSTTAASSSLPTPTLTIATPTPTDATPAIADNSAQSIDGLFAPDLATVDLSQIPEKIGYLRELGLDYGWGPSAIIETVLESLHIYGGLPWWASTIVAALAIRLVLFKGTLMASDTSAKMKQLVPLTTPIRARMLKCAREGNHFEAMKAKNELVLLHDSYGLKPWHAFAPLLQLPLGFGFFRVLRGMSSLPVPGLDSESLLWLTDLTISDPFFILPLSTGFFLHLTFKRGGETGLSGEKDTTLRKVMLYGLPGITTVAMCYWPGILQLYFVTIGAFSYLQTFVITAPEFRKWAGIASLPTPKPSTGGIGAAPRTPLRLDSDTNNVAAHAAQGPTPTAAPTVSTIDRLLEFGKTSFQASLKQAREGAKNVYREVNGSPQTRSDEIPKAPPRLSKKDLETATTYDFRRKEELELEREMRNRRRREQFMKKMQESGKEERMN